MRKVFILLLLMFALPLHGEAFTQQATILKSSAPFGLEVKNLIIVDRTQFHTTLFLRYRLVIENKSRETLHNVRFYLIHASDQVTIGDPFIQLGSLKPGEIVAGEDEATCYIHLPRVEMAPVVRLHWLVEHESSKGRKVGEALIILEVGGMTGSEDRQVKGHLSEGILRDSRLKEALSENFKWDVNRTNHYLSSKEGVEGVDVVMVIDRSGSMEGDPLQQAKIAAKQFVDLMRVGDQIAVVSFADHSVVDLPLVPITISDPGAIIFSDDAETPNQNWIADPPWERTTSASHSPTHSWTDSPYGDYSNDVDISLALSSELQLNFLSNPALYFWARYSLEEDYDYGWVEIFTNEENSWIPLRTFTGSSDWREVAIPLYEFKDQRVKFRFRLTSDSIVTDDGWYIDDIIVREMSARDVAKAVIDEIETWGLTSIGAGLLQAYYELIEKGRPETPWAIVLLSDGNENAPPFVDDVLPQVVEAGIRVFTVGLGGSVDESLLMRIAERTGGTYRFSPSPQDLSDIYNDIQSQIAGLQGVYSASGSIGPGETKEFPVVIDSSISEARFSLWLASGDVNLTLLKPDHTIVDQTIAEEDPLIDFVSQEHYKIYNVLRPDSGLWIMRVRGDSVGPEGTRISVAVHALTDLRLSVQFDKAGYIPGDPIVIVSLLRDAHGPIRSASVVGQVTKPSLETEPLELYDDGLHNDGDQGDGFYGIIYLDTADRGSYTFKIDATGVSNRGETFMRTETKATVVGQDSDGDGMPDLWEDMYGLDKYFQDAMEDPDADGLSNLEEYRHKTNPRNRDTDGDNYTDGEEVARGSNPLDPNSIPWSLVQYTLNVTKIGPGSGLITSSPVGIECGSMCNSSFQNGTKVMLMASPDLGSVFAGWSGDCEGLWIGTRVIIDSDKSCVGRFEWWPSSSCEALY